MGHWNNWRNIVILADLFYKIRELLTKKKELGKHYRYIEITLTVDGTADIDTAVLCNELLSI